MNQATWIQKLERLLLWAECLRKDEPDAFEGMLERARRGVVLTEKQTAWIEDAYKRLDLYAEEGAENLWSSGKVARGAPIETPSLLRRENPPKRPPGRGSSQL